MTDIKLAKTPDLFERETFQILQYEIPVAIASERFQQLVIDIEFERSKLIRFETKSQLVQKLKSVLEKADFEMVREELPNLSEVVSIQVLRALDKGGLRSRAEFFHCVKEARHKISTAYDRAVHVLRIQTKVLTISKSAKSIQTKYGRH